MMPASFTALDQPPDTFRPLLPIRMREMLPSDIRHSTRLPPLYNTHSTSGGLVGLPDLPFCRPRIDITKYSHLVSPTDSYFI